MKLKIASASLLLICFSLLVVPSGAIPTFSPAEAESAVSPEPSPLPTTTPTPAPSASPSVTPTPEPSPSPETDTENSLRVIRTTITTDELLDNHTYYNIDTDELLSGGGGVVFPPDTYQILILHTHSTEAYQPEYAGEYEETDPFRTTDPDYNVIRVGDELAAALESHGLRVLHDTNLYDYPSYNGSYDRSGTAAAEYLAEYTDIRLVIDLHRDALCDDEVMYSTVAALDGTDAAQLMFVMGTDINLDHPLWQDNLRLALTLHEAVASEYPTLMRPTVLCDYRYNQQLTTGYLLLEVGTSGNTLSEAITGVRLFAEAVAPLLTSWVAE